MQTKRPEGNDLASTVERSPRTRPTGIRRRGLTGHRLRAVWCSIFLVGTTVTGLVLHGQTPHGGALDGLASSSGGGPASLQVAHLIFAAGLTISIAWHLVDKRRPLLAAAKRRSRKSLRSLSAGMAFAGLLVASLATGFVNNGAGHVEHHTAVSIVLAVALGWHGARRMAARRRRSARPLPAEARP